MTAQRKRFIVRLQFQNEIDVLGKNTLNIESVKKEKEVFLAVCSDAGPRGIEPRPTVLETDVLPLNYRPVIKHDSRFAPVNTEWPKWGILQEQRRQ